MIISIFSSHTKNAKSTYVHLSPTSHPLADWDRWLSRTETIRFISSMYRVCAERILSWRKRLNLLFQERRGVCWVGTVGGLARGEEERVETRGGLPAALSIIRTLPRSLKEEPLLQEVLFGNGGVSQGVRFVVLRDEVGDYGAGFPEDDAGVGIFDC